METDAERTRVRTAFIVKPFCREGGGNFAPKARDASGGPFFSVLPENGVASGGILFSGLSEKSMQKRDAGDVNSAYAPKRHFASAHHSTKPRPAKERPSGGAFNFVYRNVPAQ